MIEKTTKNNSLLLVPIRQNYYYKVFRVLDYFQVGRYVSRICNILELVLDGFSVILNRYYYRTTGVDQEVI